MMKPFFSKSDQITQESEALIDACISGDIETVKSLFEKGADVNARDPEYGDTPLSQAALKGHLGIVTYLLSTKKLDQYSKDLALIFAAQSGNVEIIKLLVADGADVNASYFENYLPPIYQTIIQNKLPAFQYLIESQDIDLQLVALQDSLPVLMAAFHGRIDMVKAFISKGVDLNASNSEGLTIRACAEKRGHGEVVRYIDDAKEEGKLKCTP